MFGFIHRLSECYHEGKLSPSENKFESFRLEHVDSDMNVDRV